MTWSVDYWTDLAELDAIALRRTKGIGYGNTPELLKRRHALNIQARVARGLCSKHAAPVVPGRRCCRKCLDIGRAKRRPSKHVLRNKSTTDGVGSTTDGLGHHNPCEDSRRLDGD